jgi:hypothetical protein
MTLYAAPAPSLDRTLNFSCSRKRSSVITALAVILAYLSFHEAFAFPPAHADSAPLLEEIKKHLKPTAPFKATFQEKRYITVLTAPLESSGTLECVPDKGVIWKTNSPVQKTSLISPRGVSIIERSRAPRTVDDRAGISRALLSLMSGDILVASESFTLSTSGTPSRWTVTLTPRDSLVAEILKEIVVSGSSHPTSIEIKHANGDRIVQTFSPPAPINPSEIPTIVTLLNETF